MPLAINLLEEMAGTINTIYANYNTNIYHSPHTYIDTYMYTQRAGAPSDGDVHTEQPSSRQGMDCYTNIHTYARTGACKQDIVMYVCITNE